MVYEEEVVSVSHFNMSDLMETEYVEIRDRIQSLIFEGLVKKEEIMKMLEEELAEFDFHSFGYNMASGDEGTGWIKVDDISSYKGMEHDKILEDVEKWCQTDQWQAEVGSMLKKICGDDIECIQYCKEEWINGYVSYILEALEFE